MKNIHKALLLIIIVILLVVFMTVSGAKYGYEKAKKEILDWHESYIEDFCECRDSETWKSNNWLYNINVNLEESN